MGFDLCLGVDLSGCARGFSVRCRSRCMFGALPLPVRVHHDRSSAGVSTFIIDLTFFNISTEICVAYVFHEFVDGAVLLNKGGQFIPCISCNLVINRLLKAVVYVLFVLFPLKEVFISRLALIVTKAKHVDQCVEVETNTPTVGVNGCPKVGLR